jgi:hypothetical protein
MSVPFDDPDDAPPHLIGTSVDPVFAHGGPVYPALASSSNGNTTKSLDTVREATRKSTYDLLVGMPERETKSLADDAPLQIATFEC